MSRRPKGKPATQEHMLSNFGRWVIGLAGLALLAAAVWAWLSPPSLRQFAPQCAAAGCTAEVEESSIAAVVAGVSLGALLLVLAVNGRVIKAFGKEGFETVDPVSAAAEDLETVKEQVQTFEQATASEGSPDDDQDTSPLIPPAGTIKVEGVELALYDGDSVPANLMMDLLVTLNKEDFLPPTMGDLEWAARKLGRGNHAWYFKWSSSPSIWRLSYGGQGKKEPSVSAVV